MVARLSEETHLTGNIGRFIHGKKEMLRGRMRAGEACGAVEPRRNWVPLCDRFGLGCLF